MKKIIAKSFVGIALALLVVVLGIAWSFWEPANIEKDSFVYQLKVPTDAQDFPVWNKVTLPRYDVNIADGEKPSTTILRYESSLPVNALMENAEKLNFTCQKFEDNSAVCDKHINNGRSQQLIYHTAPSDKYTNVKALFIGY
jgi:hypothetical protein